MKKTLLTLLMAAALPAFAADYGTGMFAESIERVAQLSPEERRALRQRWQEASPEERAQLRREFQDRQQERSERRRERMERWQEQSGNGRDGNFGTGFERRRYENEQGSAPPPQDEHPGRFFPNRRRP